MIKFGPSGNSVNFALAGHKTAEESAVWVKDMGLDAFEYSFGRGITLGDERALSIRTAFESAGIAISVHAPYYINFANPDPEMIAKSIGYVLESAKKCRIMGGKRIIFHPASQGKDKREPAFERTKDNFLKLAEAIKAEGLDDMIFCPETMGKLAQIGTVQEVGELCALDELFIPTVDFGHVNAYEHGSLKTADDYYARLSYLIDKIGYERMKHFHVHFSKIMYSAKGEIKHLNFDDEVFGPEFEPLADVLLKLNLEPVIICESAGNQDVDSKYMKDVYFAKKAALNG